MITFLVQIGIKSLPLPEQKERRFGFSFLKRHMRSYMDHMTTRLLVSVLKDLKPLQEPQQRTTFINQHQTSLTYFKRLIKNSGSWPVALILFPTNGKTYLKLELFLHMHIPSLESFLSRLRMVEKSDLLS